MMVPMLYDCGVAGATKQKKTTRHPMWAPARLLMQLNFSIRKGEGHKNQKYTHGVQIYCDQVKPTITTSVSASRKQSQASATYLVGSSRTES